MVKCVSLLWRSFFSLFFKMSIWLSCASPYYYFLRNVSLRWLSCASLYFDTLVFNIWLYLSRASLYFERCLTRLSTLIVMCVSLLERSFFPLFFLKCDFDCHAPLPTTTSWEMSLYVDCHVRLSVLTPMCFICDFYCHVRVCTLKDVSHVSLLWLSSTSLYFDAFFFSMWLWLSCASLYFERCLTRLSTLIVKCVSLL